MLVHGSAVDIDGRGILVRGPSGSGKSDLILRLIDGGACLVADDQVEIFPEESGLFLRPPATIAGMLEIRGLGIVELPWHAPVPLMLIVDLAAADAIERLPNPETVPIAGRSVSRLALYPWEVSATAKVRLAVRTVDGVIMMVP